MLLQNLSLLFRNPVLFFLLLAATGAALLIGITVHEFSHALAASRLGDTTARRLGRLSLNPLRHLDPLGTAMLLLVGFGWGKPVPVNPVAFGPRARQGMSLVALSGPLANLATAAVVAIPFKAGVLPWGFLRLSVFPLRGGEELLAALLGYVVFYNLILAVFNLIPLAPLDGFSVALGLLPRDLANAFARLERYGPAILLVVILLDMVVGFGILGRVIYPIVNALGNVFVGRRLL